jgi:hypothetical protein
LKLKGYEYKGSRISIVQDYSKPTWAVRQANVNFERAIAAKTGEKVIITKKGDFIIAKGRLENVADLSIKYGVPFAL